MGEGEPVSLDVTSNNESWPQSYEPGTLEPLGNVWERTGGVVGTGEDIVLDNPNAPNLTVTVIVDI